MRGLGVGSRLGQGKPATSSRGRVWDRKRELQSGSRSREAPSSPSSTLPRSFSNSGLLTTKSWSFRELPTLLSPAELSKTPHVLFPRPPSGAAACSRYLLRGRARGPQSLKPLRESLHGRREKPAPPGPGAPPHGLPSRSRSPSSPPSLLQLGVVPSPPFLLLRPHPCPNPASLRAVSSKHGKIRNKK